MLSSEWLLLVSGSCSGTRCLSPADFCGCSVIGVCVIFLPSPQGRSQFGVVQASVRTAWMLPNLGCYGAVDGLRLRVCWRGWVHRVWEEHGVSNICAALPWESTCRCFVEFLCSLLGAGMGVGGLSTEGCGERAHCWQAGWGVFLPVLQVSGPVGWGVWVEGSGATHSFVLGEVTLPLQHYLRLGNKCPCTPQELFKLLSPSCISATLLVMLSFFKGRDSIFCCPLHFPEQSH